MKAIQIGEITFTAVYVFLTMPELPISKDSFEMIVHMMGIVRVNSFSVTFGEVSTIATGLYWPANFINHDCAQPRANI